MELVYRLTGTGWSEAWIADGDAAATVTASYLSDALGNLLAAVVALLDGAAEARCSWDEEPGEFRWLFAREGGRVHLRILGFRELWGDEPDERGTVVFETRQDLRVLAAAVASAAERVLAEHGEEGYLAKWVDAPFPTALLGRLRAYSDAAS